VSSMDDVSDDDVDAPPDMVEAPLEDRTAIAATPEFMSTEQLREEVARLQSMLVEPDDDDGPPGELMGIPEDDEAPDWEQGRGVHPSTA